eukprot:1151234-Pelagomonas_calceolata.AAC.6
MSMASAQDANQQGHLTSFWCNPHSRSAHRGLHILPAQRAIRQACCATVDHYLLSLELQDPISNPRHCRRGAASMSLIDGARDCGPHQWPVWDVDVCAHLPPGHLSVLHRAVRTVCRDGRGSGDQLGELCALCAVTDVALARL